MVILYPYIQMTHISSKYGMYLSYRETDIHSVFATCFCKIFVIIKIYRRYLWSLLLVLLQCRYIVHNLGFCFVSGNLFIVFHSAQYKPVFAETMYFIAYQEKIFLINQDFFAQCAERFYIVFSQTIILLQIL